MTALCVLPVTAMVAVDVCCSAVLLCVCLEFSEAANTNQTSDPNSTLQAPPISPAAAAAAVVGGSGAGMMECCLDVSWGSNALRSITSKRTGGGGYVLQC